MITMVPSSLITMVPSSMMSNNPTPTATIIATATAASATVAPTPTTSASTATVVPTTPKPKPVVRTCGSSFPKPPEDAFWSLSKINEYLDKLQKTFGTTKINVIEVPNSNGQKVVWIRPYWKKNVKNAKIISDRPAFWVEAGFEANHAIGVATALDFIDRKLCECTYHCYYDYYVVPLVNPKGYDYAMTTDSTWVKTRDDVGSGCNGTNLLNNFSGGLWSSGNSTACSPLYRGTAAFSAPETYYQSIKRPLKANIKMSFTITGKNMTLNYGSAYSTTVTNDGSKAYLQAFQKAAPDCNIGQYAATQELAYGHPLDYNQATYKYSFNFAPKNIRLASDLPYEFKSFVDGMNAAITYAKTDQKFSM